MSYDDLFNVKKKMLTALLKNRQNIIDKKKKDEKKVEIKKEKELNTKQIEVMSKLLNKIRKNKQD